MLLSCGERISMALLAMALEERGLSAISFTGSQSGILTNDRHSGARIIEVRPVRIEDELERGKVVIVAGFQGMSYKREITTLGRGGSDTTAVALAAALGADYCEICSDVDGVYTADPRVVPEAQRLDAIGYDEMQELAEHGAKVLNAAGGRVGEEGEDRRSTRARRRARPAATARRRASASGGSRAAPHTAIERSRRDRGDRHQARRRSCAATCSPSLDEERIALRHAAGRARALRARRRARLAARREAPAPLPARASRSTARSPSSAPASAATRRRCAARWRPPATCTSGDASPLRVTLTVASERVDDVTRALHAALWLMRVCLDKMSLPDGVRSSG